MSDRSRQVSKHSEKKPSSSLFAIRLVLAAHYVIAGVGGLVVTQGEWSKKGEPIRLLLMGGAVTMLVAAVLLMIRRPWSWWATLFSLAASLAVFSLVTVFFISAGDPNSHDANVGYVAPIFAGVLLLTWLFTFFTATGGLFALAGLIVLLLPATRRDFWLEHAEPGPTADRNRM